MNVKLLPHQIGNNELVNKFNMKFGFFLNGFFLKRPQYFYT